MLEKLLPQNVEAEMGVLGSIILDPEAIVEIADFLYASDFYRDAHRTIYEVVLSLYSRREPADFITICDELERRGELEEVGGATYITSLINQVPTSGNVEFYGRIVERTAILRRLIHAAGQIAALAYEQVPDALARAETLILSLGRESRATSFVSIGEYLPTYLAHLDEVQQSKEKVRGIPTGIGDLDALALLQRGDLIVPAARPGVGKTTLCQNIAYNAALKYGKRVGFFSCEMTLDALMDGFVSRDTGINSQNLLTGTLTDAEYERLVNENALELLGIYLKHTPGIFLEELAHEARKLVSRHKIDLLIVDYLQLVRARIDGKRVTPREMEVAEVTRGLKALAGELNIPILCPAQISREIEHRAGTRDEREHLTYKMPMLSDMRESGEIEQSADVVACLAQSEERNERVKLIILKNRRGPKGELDLYFRGETKQFLSLEEVYTS